MTQFLIIDNLSFILEAHEFSDSSTKGSTLKGKQSLGTSAEMFGNITEPHI